MHALDAYNILKDPWCRKYIFLFKFSGFPKIRQSTSDREYGFPGVEDFSLL